METLYLVTHAEATHHVERRVGGWFDSELTAAGHNAARQIADELLRRVKSPPKVFSSDLKRAFQTATPIAHAFSAQIETSADLREVSCGIAEGETSSWLNDRIEMPPLEGNRLDHQICGEAETRRQAATRIYRFMGDLMASRNQDVVIVTHGFALSFVISAWLGMPIESLGRMRYCADSGSVTELDFDPDWGDRRLVTLNETSHLLRESDDA